MSGKKMTGMKVKLFVLDAVSGKVLGGQQGASLERSAESIDATSKDTEGFWTESLPGFKSWSVDCDGAFIADDEAYGILETSFLNSENVIIYLEMPSGKKYQGSATITDSSLDFPYDDLVTYSLSFQGSGKLEIVEADGLDRQMLSAAKNIARTKVEAEYTTLTWTALASALVLPEATQTNINAKAIAINTALVGLKTI